MVDLSWERLEKGWLQAFDRVFQLPLVLSVGFEVDLRGQAFDSWANQSGCPDEGRVDGA
jgi:hypothetical protein